MRVTGIYLPIAFTSLIQGGAALFAVYLSTRGYSVSETVLPLSLMGVGGLLGSFLGGILSDYIKPRLVGMLLAAMWLFMPLGFNTDNYFFVCGVMLLVGFSLSSLRTIYLAVITSQYTGEEVELRLSHRRLILNLGVAAGSSLIGYVLKYEHTLFSYYFMIVGALTLVSTAFLPNNSPNKEGKQAVEGSHQSRYSDYVFLLLALFLTLLSFGLIPNLYALYLKEDVGLSEVVLGNMFAISGVLIAILQVPMTKWLKNISGKVKSLIGMGLIGVGVGGAQLIQTDWHLYLSTAIWTLGEIVLFVPILKELLKVTPLTNGKTIASYQIAFSASEILAPLLGGALILINYQALWNVVLGSTAISIGITAYLCLKEKNNEYYLNQYRA
ncbi:MFS transporter [Vibrio lentus]|uniref:MFS transporter n=1 Tax=Vibrio lentus TaxID=136468 RepID=A0AB36XLS6_9VIBR|nr:MULTISPECIES: MFS transporter [Vibrio]MCC4838818.1 MFS transporter [Vibrio lentus]PMI15548.1 hypothetical protein BCU51_16415 [Vibrio lentus]PMJ80598.1 hypothetical protein BCU14_20080 [Vibrio lentus]PMK31539.1 hypothetical protein BCU02_02690 [Vibrio lentus]PMK46431.1 hypothetical protein BCT99_20850 [Vibrio lentus]